MNPDPMPENNGDEFAYLNASETDNAWPVTTVYDRYGRAIDPAGPPLPPPDGPLLQLFKHTFEFRLLGGEVQKSEIRLRHISPDERIVVTTGQVRTFVTRRGEPGAASNFIGGVEVSTEQLPETADVNGKLVCTAQATDFGPGDLIVIGVDVTIYRVICTEEPS